MHNLHDVCFGKLMCCTQNKKKNKVTVAFVGLSSLHIFMNPQYISHFSKAINQVDILAKCIYLNTA